MKFSLAFTVLKQLTVGVVAVSVATWLTIGTALAWVNPTAPLSDQSSAINFWNNCGTTNKEIWAQDGDVLTTTKWNQALCTYFFNFAMWGDWPRGKTPATWSNGHIGAAENTINGQKGTYLEVLLLASPGGGGGVNFYDANRQFPTQPDGRSNVLGSVQYHRPGQPGFETSKEGLHLLSANGPVWIDTCIGTTVNPYCDDTINAGRPTDSPNQYPIGWVSVNLYDTADFDIQCQYRVHETLV
ncbi:MAG TPA: hypothetical protein PK765_02210 [bacterium]|nr:hypothetical protein [bacterium]